MDITSRDTVTLSRWDCGNRPHDPPEPQWGSSVRGCSRGPEVFQHCIHSSSGIAIPAAHLYRLAFDFVAKFEAHLWTNPSVISVVICGWLSVPQELVGILRILMVSKS